MRFDQIFDHNRNEKQWKYGNIEIIFKEEKTIDEFVKSLKKVKRLIEISTLKSVDVSKITGWNKNIYDIYGESKYERAISIISSGFGKKDDKKIKNNFRKIWRLLTLSELIESKAFDKYLGKYEVLEPIIELYLQIIVSKEISNIRAF